MPEELNLEEFAERVRRGHELFRRNRRINGEILETIGVELESIGLSQKIAKGILGGLPYELGNNFKVHRDASSEMNTYSTVLQGRRDRICTINAHTIESQNLFSRKIPVSTSGYELISIPMDIRTTELTLWSLLPKLESQGDFISERCATHIHIGMAKNLGMIKNMLKLGLWADELFYSLSGMGEGRFRGYSNNAIFSRPLINGPYFYYRGNYYQSLNWKKALEAHNFYEFFACYGIDTNGEAVKYHPARYFSINLYSLLLHNTVEFRHFNQSFSPSVLIAITKLCQLFVEIGIKANESLLSKLEPGDVFQTQNTSHYIEKLHKLLYLGGICSCDYIPDNEDVEELETVICSYQGIGIKNVAVLSHINPDNIVVSQQAIEDGNLSKANIKPIPDGHVDIHNIKLQSIIK